MTEVEYRRGTYCANDHGLAHRRLSPRSQRSSMTMGCSYRPRSTPNVQEFGLTDPLNLSPTGLKALLVLQAMPATQM